MIHETRSSHETVFRKLAQTCDHCSIDDVWCYITNKTIRNVLNNKCIAQTLMCSNTTQLTLTSLFVVFFLSQNQMPTPPSLAVSSPVAQTQSAVSGSGASVGPQGPPSNLHQPAPQSGLHTHCPPLLQNSPSPARSLTPTPAPHQTPPQLPGNQTPQPHTPTSSTTMAPPATQLPPMAQGVGSEKASQLQQQSHGGGATGGPQTGLASSVPSQNTHGLCAHPHTPVSMTIKNVFV